VDFVRVAQNPHHRFLGMWVVLVKAYCFCGVAVPLFRIMMRKKEFTKPKLTLVSN
jgi:hypothetical protein